MPTPSHDVERADDSTSRSSHLSCPPDEDRWIQDRRIAEAEQEYIADNEEEPGSDSTTNVAPTSSPPHLQIMGRTQPRDIRSSSIPNTPHIKDMDAAEEEESLNHVGQTEVLSPVSSMEGGSDKHGESEQRLGLGEMGGVSSGYEFSNIRLKPSTPSSFLRSGSKFHGTQQSERQIYDVQVEIKHVDMKESFLCGYLRIQGLTEDHPTLTTYFEGEIIGSKYSFLTQHEDWGSTDKVDLQHWAKFVPFRQYASAAKRGDLYIANLAQKENIFMRWKEHFLVPDHRVRTISGASFEGFYYICFNQVEGGVHGIYFHAKSEKFQQLELKHVPDRGCFGAMEFR